MSLLNITVFGALGRFDKEFSKSIVELKNDARNYLKERGYRGRDNTPMNHLKASYAPINKHVLGTIENIRKNHWEGPFPFYCNLRDHWTLSCKLISPMIGQYGFSTIADTTLLTLLRLRRSAGWETVFKKMNGFHSDEEKLFARIVCSCAQSTFCYRGSSIFICFEAKGASLGDDEIVAFDKNGRDWLPAKPPKKR